MFIIIIELWNNLSCETGDYENQAPGCNYLHCWWDNIWRVAVGCSTKCQ